MKKRILFVDDEPMVLQGLQRLLRPMREQLEMEFVESGAQALERLHLAAYDVVVTDMMMPGMNGVQLLEQVRRAAPQTIRLVLSGHTEQQLALQCVGVAHQFLSKPCAAETLRSTIARVTDLDFAVRSERLLHIVGHLERLPSLPAIYSRLVELLEDPNTSTEEIGALMERDIALAAQLLKTVNSAFFGLAQRVTKLADAAAYLGLDTLKALVLTAGLFEQWSVNPASGYVVKTAADHSQMVGAAARLIAQTERAPRAVADECFMAGLLHDVGKLILACNLPAQYAKYAALERGELHGDEGEIFGTTHAEMGGYLLGLWGLPQAVVAAIRWHHAPGEAGGSGFSALTAVHVADHLVRDTPNPLHPLDERYLSELGLTDRLPIWRAAVAANFSSNSATTRSL